MFDPYHRWLGIPPADQPPDHYRLLGVQRFEADPDVIESAANQRVAYLRTFQSGTAGWLSGKLLKEVAAAKVCLLKPDTKAAYDRQLRQELGARSSRTANRGMSGSSPAAGETSVGTVDGVEKPATNNVPLPCAVPVATAGPPRVVQPASAIPVASSPSASHVPPPLPSRATRRRRHISPGAIVALFLVAAMTVLVGLMLWSGSHPAENAGEPTVGKSVKSESREPVKPRPKLPAVAPTASGPDAGELASNTPTAAVDIQPEADPTPPGFTPPVFNPSAVAEKPAPKKPAVASPTQRLPVPPDDVLRQVARQLNTIHTFDGARTAKEKLELAKRLCDAAKASEDKPDERYILLRKAMELAGDAGDAVLMLAAAGAIGKRFEVDAAGLQETALMEFAAKATDTAMIESLVTASRGVIERAAVDGRFGPALKLASLAQRACQQPQGRKVRKEAAQRLTWVQALHERHQQVQQAQTAFEANQQDAEANLFLARWHCLDQGDWQRGLPHLAKAGDAVLKSLAQQDLTSPPTTQDAQIKLADAWWDVAQQHKGDDHDLALLRAGHWYKQAQDGRRSDLVQLKIEKRLDEVTQLQQARQAAQQRLRPPSGQDSRGNLWSDVL